MNEFFEEVTETLFYGSLPDFQKIPLVMMIEEFDRRGWTDKRKLAYIMATTYHETNRFKASSEYGKGKGRDYGEPLLMIRGVKKAFYGRGWVQLTWLQNYAKLSVAATMALGRPIDLVNDPDKVFEDDEVNAFITFEGMSTGLFTGKKLGDYIGNGKCDYTNARRVINGTDRAADIAEVAKKFESALEHVDLGDKDGTKQRYFRFRK